ncbi:hypothetical protein ACA910_004715 [Epithemia clementina (nom. ined.)]
MTNQNPEPDSLKSSGDLLSREDGTPPAKKRKLFKKLSFSLQVLGGRRVHEFDASVVCDLGIPVYEKVVNLIAGLHNVHPSRVSLCVRDPKYPLSSTIRGDEDLKMAFKTYGAEEKELALEISFSNPLFIEFSLQGGTDSCEIVGIGGVLKGCGHVSLDHLEQLANDTLKKPVLSMLGKTCKSALSSDEKLLNLLYNTEGHKLQVEVVPHPAPIVKLGLSNAQVSRENMERSSNWMKFYCSNDTATWSMPGLTPGMYKARITWSSDKSGRFQVEFNEGFAEGSTSVFNYSPTGGHSRCEAKITESFALVESFAVQKFALKVLDFHPVYVYHVTLEYVGLLKRK